MEEYNFNVKWSEEDDCWLAKCSEFNYLTAHGYSVMEALREINIAIDGVKELLTEDKL